MPTGVLDINSSGGRRPVISSSSRRHRCSVLFVQIPPDGLGRPPPSGQSPRVGIQVSGVDAGEEVFEHCAVEPRREVPVVVVAEVECRAEEAVVADEEVW